MVDTLFFYFFSLLALGGGIVMITRRNIVVCAVWLIVSLLGVAGLFLLSAAEFLFVAQLIIYIGGVVLLFLIALMLINLQSETQIHAFRSGWQLILAAVAGLAAELIALLRKGTLPETSGTPAPMPNTETLADVLFSRYLVAFELASVILLVAIVGAVIMGQRRNEAQS